MIKTGIYVDDVLSGADNLEDAIKLHNKLHGLFMAGALLLKKWNSSNHELMQRIPDDLHALSPDISWQSETLVSMLGLTLKPSTDCFIFQVEIRPIKDVITKRLVVSQSAQLFDPLGWLAPVIIVAKIFIQELWKLNLSCSNCSASSS
ncbi:uncharacterized protein LOC117170088 [Belonocnema kinseyi]|uniref:uncharacterized protein LOC117170088 n=1 Tax=Belonocnema kinseyi TaxID=2817044 RepID=UPI00143DA6F8|nr:uncharacterized protein LOC117170088 [Belonocnema kinseyi]